jgi:hypothetical protein
MPAYRTPAQRAAQTPHRGGGHHRASNQVVPMDVDAGQFAPLTPEEKSDLMTKRACFYCRKPGHISKACRTRAADRAKGKTDSARAGAITPQESPSRETGPQIVDKDGLLKQMGGAKGLLEHVKTQSAELQEEFVDALQGF